jgi:hypothetical protein
VDSLDTLVRTRPGSDPGHPEARRVLPSRPVERDSPGVQTLLLGRYRLLECLGAGGFGVVWRAHDELLDREVAVKRISLGAGGDPIDGERAGREALAGARLAHPAIVVLHEACAEPDAFYLISELVHGDTLAQLIAARALGDEELLEIGRALTDALAHAHARGVIHRDVKPQNVLIPHHPDERGGVAKLTDFGGARLAGEDALTRTGDVLGTLAYMAPEQSEGREAAAPADLYSLALVLYEGLSGVNPVRGPTPAATARRIGSQLEPLERRRGDLPRSLTRAIDLALAPRPEQRGTLRDLHLALEAPLGRGRRRKILQHRPSAALEDLTEAPEELHQGEASLVPSRRLALPRAVWMGSALALIAWQIYVGRPGVGLLLFAAAAPLVVLPRRCGVAWLTAALAPVLGLAGLAGAFPALAGQRERASERAALAALGYWWLILAEPLLNRNLWLITSAGTPPRAVWEGSLSSAATHVIGPTLSLSVLAGVGVWAVAAALLPWVVRGRSATLDVVAATAWSAALLLAFSPRYLGLSSAHLLSATPHGAVLGALLGGVLAVGARALRGPV